MRLPLTPSSQLVSCGVSLLLASQCFLEPGRAVPPPGLMSIEQARELSALQEMGSLPSEQKKALRAVGLICIPNVPHRD